MKFSLALGIASLFSLSTAQSTSYLYPVITKNITAPQSTKIVADISSYIGSLTAQPAYTSAASVLANQDPDLANEEDVQGDPLSLAEMLLFATATPDWYGSLPTDVQAYVSSVAAAQATILAKDSGAADRRVWVSGALMAAGMVAVVLL